MGCECSTNWWNGVWPPDNEGAVGGEGDSEILERSSRVTGRVGYFLRSPEGTRERRAMGARETAGSPVPRWQEWEQGPHWAGNHKWQQCRLFRRKIVFASSRLKMDSQKWWAVATTLTQEGDDVCVCSGKSDYFLHGLHATKGEVPTNCSKSWFILVIVCLFFFFFINLIFPLFLELCVALNDVHFIPIPLIFAFLTYCHYCLGFIPL